MIEAWDWPVIVRGLQTFTAVTWLYPLWDKLPSVRRMLWGKPERWDAPWSAFWVLALTQLGFSVRWMIWPHQVYDMPTAELAFWSGLYLSSAMTCIGMVYTQGLTAGQARNRRALLAHICTLLLCLAATVAVA